MTKCKQCGAAVEWKRDESGKWMCHNAGTTTDHWDLCSKRRFDRIKETGEYFATEKSRGYFTDLKASGVQYVMQKSDMVPAKVHKRGHCNDCVPPWEICPKPCPIAIGEKRVRQ